MEQTKLIDYKGRNADPPHWKFGTSKRGKGPNQLTQSVSPGPGSYQLPPAFGNVAPYEKIVIQQ
jgi:hypothetical protein